MQNHEINNKLAVLAGVLLMMSYGFIGNTLGFFVLPVTEGLGISRASFNLYFTIMSVTGMAAAPLFGRLYGRIALSRIVLAGMIVGSLSFAVMSFAGSIAVFYAVGVILGLVQQSTTSVTAAVLINRIFGDKAGGPMGIAMAGTGMISMLMSFVLPGFIARSSWRSGYRLQAVLWCCFMLSAVFLLRKIENAQAADPGPKTRGARNDGAGQSDGNPRKSQGENDLMGGRQNGSGRNLLRPCILLFICIFVCCICSVFIHHMPAYYAERGLSTVLAGSIVGFFNIGLIFCKVFAGWLYDRMDHAKAAALFTASMAAGLFIMSMEGMGLILAGTMVLAFGMPTITVLFPLITRHIAGGEHYAGIWSIMSMAVSLGTALGSPLWGAIYDAKGSYISGMKSIPMMVAGAAVVLYYLAKNSSAGGSASQPGDGTNCTLSGNGTT